MDAQTLFSYIFGMTLTASVIILFVLVMRLLLKRAPKIFSYVLWGAVLFRLLCPVALSSNLSLLQLFTTPSGEPQEWVGELVYLDYQADPEEITMEYPDADNANPTAQQQQENPQPSQDDRDAFLMLEECIPYLWVSGSVGLMLYGIGASLRLHRRLVGAVRMDGNVYMTDYSGTPFVVGIFRPRIYLPSSISLKEIPYIVAHERHHIQRMDHIVKKLSWVALCIHWFNPLVWIAFILSEKDMEMSCDEAVIQKLGEGIRADYSASLLSLATRQRVMGGTPLAFGEGDTKGRVLNMAKWKKPKRWIVILCWVLCVFTLAACVSDPLQNTIPETSDSGEESTRTENSDSSEKFFVTSQIPDDLYRITAKSPGTISLDERAAAVQELGGIFGCTPLVQDGIYYEAMDTMQFPTREGGLIAYDGAGILYAAPGADNCSVLEAHGDVERVAVIDLSIGGDSGVSYSVGGEDYSVADAVTYVENLWDQNLRPYTWCEDVRVGSVLVYKEQDETYRYVLLLDKYVEGLAVEQYSTVANAAVNQGFRPSFILVEMDAPDHIYFYRDYGSFEILDLEDVELLMDANAAVAQADKLLADYMDYTIQEQTLKYCFFVTPEMTDAGYEGTYTGYPYWCLVLEWGKEGGYIPDNYRPNVTLYIDPFTGTAYLSDTLYGEELQIAK